MVTTHIYTNTPAPNRLTRTIGEPGAYRTNFSRSIRPAQSLFILPAYALALFPSHIFSLLSKIYLFWSICIFLGATLSYNSVFAAPACVVVSLSIYFAPTPHHHLYTKRWSFAVYTTRYHISITYFIFSEH